jgi:hypothetical protein
VEREGRRIDSANQADQSPTDGPSCREGCSSGEIGGRCGEASLTLAAATDLPRSVLAFAFGTPRPSPAYYRLSPDRCCSGDGHYPGLVRAVEDNYGDSLLNP